MVLLGRSGGCFAHEANVRGLLLVDNGNQPVLKGELAAGAEAAWLGEHLLATGAGSLVQIARSEELAAKRGQVLLGGADVERVTHGHDRASTRPHSGGDGGMGVFGVLVDGGGLAGVGHLGRQAMLAQQRAERLGGNDVRLAVGGLEHQAALGSLQYVISSAYWARPKTHIARLKTESSRQRIAGGRIATSIRFRVVGLGRLPLHKAIRAPG